MERTSVVANTNSMNKQQSSTALLLRQRLCTSTLGVGLVFGMMAAVIVIVTLNFDHQYDQSADISIVTSSGSGSSNVFRHLKHKKRNQSSTPISIVNEIAEEAISFDSLQESEGFVHEIEIDMNNNYDTTTMNDNKIEEEVNEIMVMNHEDEVVIMDNDNESILIDAMRKKLQPKSIQYTYDPITNSSVYRPHQFLHLHHMKTGGTSFDRLLSCGKSRLEQYYNQRIPYTNIHECSEMSYDQCYDGTNSICQKNIMDASIMSYCAPLKDLVHPFNWTEALNSNSDKDDVDKVYAVTVFRNPIARVWSMYRFQTKACYECRSLIDIYNEIDNGTSTIRSMCQSQLQNHLTRNILSDGTITNDTLKIINAKENLKSFFTLIGLTEDMETTGKMVGIVFPWLNIKYENSNLQCDLPHANASPQNNYCGPGGKHMPLPDIPDDITTELIIKHNALDIELYNTALEQFRLQKLALQL